MVWLWFKLKEGIDVGNDITIFAESFQATSWCNVGGHTYISVLARVRFQTIEVGNDDDDGIIEPYKHHVYIYEFQWIRCKQNADFFLFSDMSLLLMNSTYLSPQTLMTPITDMQPVYDRNDTYNASHLLRHEQKRKQQRQALQLLEEETDKKRRSLNIPEYGMPKEARLFNMKQNTLIQVHPDGRVSTTRNASSTLCEQLLQFSI